MTSTHSFQQRAAAAGATVVLAAVGFGIANGVSGGSGATSAAATPAGMPRPGSTPPGGAPEQLTGATARKVRQAALSRVPGGTVLRTERDPGGSGYHAHVRRADGSLVLVRVSTAFEATAVETMGTPPSGQAPPPGRST